MEKQMSQVVIPFTHARRITALIDSQTLRRDAEGRYSLTDIHRMSGRFARHRPGSWAQSAPVNHQTDTFRDLYLNFEPIVVATTGPIADRGTYAIAELAILYADWIDPSLGQRLRALIAAGSTVQDAHECYVQAAALLTEASEGRLTVTVTVNDNVPDTPAYDPDYITRLIASYVDGRKVVAIVDVRETVHNLIGVDIDSWQVGRILRQLCCQRKHTGHGDLYITPLGLESGLSLDSAGPLLTEAHIVGLRSADVRLAAAA